MLNIHGWIKEDFSGKKIFFILLFIKKKIKEDKILANQVIRHFDSKKVQLVTFIIFKMAKYMNHNS